ncbi:MAG: ECF transporter S component [Clostridia bacterium]|nr:ECF transporter S component [Clostridia bacterium]
MKQRNRAAQLALAGMLAALIFVATSFFRLPVSLTQGYIHLGDGFILLGAALLGGKAAVIAAALGSALADLLGGYTMYILPTFLIKGAMAAVAVVFMSGNRPLWVRIAGMLLSEAVMVLGYFVVEWLVLGYGLAAAAGALIPNVVQGLSGVIIGVVLLPLVGRVKEILKM